MTLSVDRISESPGVVGVEREHYDAQTGVSDVTCKTFFCFLVCRLVGMFGMGFVVVVAVVVVSEAGNWYSVDYTEV